MDSSQMKTNYKELFESIKRCEDHDLNHVSYYPSVTTILSSTMSVQSVVALDKWKKLKTSQLGEKGFRDYQKNILSRGKLLHLNIKNFLQTKDESYPQLIPANKWLFNQRALQEYLLCCCQEASGGLIDKPGKNRDYYHTCYCLSGLSIAQNSLSSQLIVGPQENKVAPIHPLFNVRLDSVRFAKEYFTANT
ncbi:unnamed protein product [Oppiella nova]|uniref:Prenyltransferase alpha-alpha toroid domain-containing protein n=1 Tax=Oppiella nova TaxID=334625 RepID=A0A7R9M5Q3_9ACAR|nr:unnamed protein product [Oppiella nova]CAG2171252.1 unnamed protein product [Oppiella nova]